jgi:hypothetical protein
MKRGALYAAWTAFVLSARTVLAEEPAGYGAHATSAGTVESGAVVVDAADAQRRAGSLGEPARALLDVPGAARASFAGGELVVWGAAPSETRAYVDGVEIPALFHPAGFRTTVHPALLRRVSLTPGAPSAQFGRGLGGVAELTTRTLRDPTAHAALRADAIDTSLSSEGGAGPVRALVAARYGYLDRVVGLFAPASSGGVLAVPAHLDGTARVEGQPDLHTRLQATWIGAQDRTRVDGAPRPTDSQHRSQGYQLLMLRYERRYTDGARVRITPFASLDDSAERSAFARTPLALSQHAFGGGVRAEYTRTIAALTLRLGVDARVAYSRVQRSGTLTLPAREGDIRLFGQAPLAALNADDYRTTLGNVAPHATLTFSLGALTLEPGLRLEGLFAASSRSVPRFPGAPAVGHDDLWLFADPRLRVAWAALPTLTLEARGGIYHQAPEARDLSSVFGAPTLRPARAFHGALGALVSLPSDVRLALWGYAKQLDQLAVRSALAPPDLAQALVATGRGSAVGGSLSLDRAAERGPFGSLSYTLSHSLRSDPDGTLRRFDYDQPHVLAALAGYAFEALSITLRLRAASGNPRTRVLGSYLDTTSGLAEPLFGRHNGARNPAFFEADLHIERSFAWSRCALALWLDVLNATAHTNVESVAYTADFRARRDVRGLPLVAMLGARLGY